ncbi:MAG: HPr-rel-A system PqqD family peptide chaperone [Pseudomonadota bacterium]
MSFPAPSASPAVANCIKWQLIDGQQLQHRSWDDDCVAYNNLSGDTHLLNSTAMFLLLALQAGPADLPELAAAVRAEFEVDPDVVLEDQLATLLSELHSLSLIEARA